MGWHAVVVRACGGLVALAGMLHLAMTGHLMHWFRAVSHDALPGTAYAAMLLNHVVVGVLLMAVGASLWFAGPLLGRRERGAIAIAGANALAVLALPVIVVLTATPDMLDAPPFVIAAALLALAALLNIVAIAAAMRRRPNR